VCYSFVTSNDTCVHLSNAILPLNFSNVPNFKVIPIDYNYSEVTHIEKMKKFAITTEIRLSIDTIYPYRVRSVLLTVI
jgi:hypothetical protein